jgi:EAL domain-containing protein (putative c-di-GMP-specific phosphodiesterase class I)
MSALNPNDVLADLFEEMLVQNSEELAAAVIQRLLDAGFKIVLIDD